MFRFTIPPDGVGRKCIVCGDPLAANKQKFCSNRCRCICNGHPAKADRAKAGGCCERCAEALPADRRRWCSKECAGACPEPGCGARRARGGFDMCPPHLRAKGLLRCKTCLAPITAPRRRVFCSDACGDTWMKRRFVRRAASGLCSTCGRAADRPGLSTCSACARSCSGSNARAKGKFAAAGRCTRCGVRPPKPRGRYCVDCLSYSRAVRDACPIAHGMTWAEYSNRGRLAREAARAAAHKCAKCGRGGRMRKRVCGKCHRRAAAASRAFRARRAARGA